MLSSWLDDALQGFLIPLAAMLPLLEALPHAGLPGALIMVVPRNATEVQCPIHPGPPKFSVAMLIVKDAGREPCTDLVHLDDLQRMHEQSI